MLDSLTRARQRFSRARFERQVEDLLPELYRTARALVATPSDAEDLTHDTCVKALAGFDRAALHCAADCRAWLHRILVNAYRDRYRRERQAPVRAAAELTDASESVVIEFAASREPDPSRQHEYDDFSAAADAAIAALPPELRLVGVLHLVNGLSYREIAEVTRSPLGTVMSRLHRARRLLRAQLAEHVSASDAGASPPLEPGNSRSKAAKP